MFGTHSSRKCPCIRRRGTHVRSNGMYWSVGALRQPAARSGGAQSPATVGLRRGSEDAEIGHGWCCLGV